MGVELERPPIGVPRLARRRDLELEPQLVPVLGREVLLDAPRRLRGPARHRRRPAGEVGDCEVDLHLDFAARRAIGAARLARSETAKSICIWPDSGLHVVTPSLTTMRSPSAPIRSSASE